jgi:hypothetical protein
MQPSALLLRSRKKRGDRLGWLVTFGNAITACLTASFTKPIAQFREKYIIAIRDAGIGMDLNQYVH